MNLFYRIEHPIQHWVHIGLHFIQQHPHWGFIFAFLVSFTESLPVLGTVIPGSITMTAVGTLIGTGTLPFSITILWAIIGAFMGDYTGYFIGYRYHNGIRKVWPLKQHPKILDAGEAYFRRHGGKSIFIGRFIGPLRSAMPLIAGCMQMKPVRFVVAAFPSAILWALAYTIPGILLGALSMDVPKGQMVKFLLSGLAVIVFLWALLWLLKTTFKTIYQYYRQAMQTLWQDGIRDGPLRRLKDPKNPDNDAPLRQLTAAFIAMLLFCLVWILMRYSDTMIAVNHAIATLMANTRHPFLFHLMAHITLLANITTLLGMTLIFGLYLFRQQQQRAILFIALSAILTTLLTYSIKILSKHPRPDFITHVPHSGSFPSGHVALALAIYGSIATILVARRSNTFRYSVNAILVLLVALVAYSRLYLGMHWLSDVIASIFLTLTTLNLIKALCPPMRHQQQHSNDLLWLLVAFLLSYIISNVVGYAKIVKQSSLRHKSITTSVRFWWQHPTQVVATIRNNRLGQPSQALNIQWLGSQTTIEQQLQQSGWHNIKRSPKLQKTLKRFASYQAKDHMPLLPPLFQYRRAAITLIKLGSYRNEDIEIRLWAANIHFRNSRKQLWVGNISFHLPPNKLISIRKQDRSRYLTDNTLSTLQHGINPKQFATKLMQISLPNQSKTLLNWNGSLLLIKSR